MDNRVASLRRLLRIHIVWLSVKLLGRDIASKEELAELENYGRLSLGDEVGLIERSFILGRTSATSKQSDYKDLTLEKLSRLQKRKFSNAEKLALREAKLHTSRSIQALADYAAAEASARVNKANQDLLADATVKEILEDEVAMAVVGKRSRQQLATTVSNTMGRDLTSGLKKLLVTEIHRAKTRGVAMAISNRVDIYSNSLGVESIVSVVPNRGACEDCRNLYLTDTGNPKTFRLSALVGLGSNSDKGVSHSRIGGLHLGWKPVLPPAHPNCYCELTYVPPGMSWVSGKLVITDKLRYKNQIRKAVDKGTMSATITPKGPPGAKDDTPKVGSIAGVPAPGNVAGPGRTPSPQSVAEAAMPAQGSAPANTPAPKQPEDTSSGKDMVPCPYGGDIECSNHAGNGAKEHERNGTIMDKHEDFDDFKAAVEEEQKDPVLSAEEIARQLTSIADYKAGLHTKAQQDKDLSSGTIIRRKDIKDVVEDEDSAGVSSSQVKVEKVDIADNGSGLVKPPLPSYPQTAGHEVAANRVQEIYGSKNDLGGKGRCPHTTYRVEDNVKSSIQGWIYGSKSGISAYKEAFQAGQERGPFSLKGMIRFLLKKSTNPDQTRAHIEETICSDIIMNNIDRHAGNMMFKEDSGYAVDHGFVFGRGMNAYRNHYHEGMVSNNMKVKIPESMRTKIQNTTFSQLHSSLLEHTTTWRAAQTYIRAQYLLHVQDVYGKIPYEEIGGGESHGQNNLVSIIGVRYNDPSTFDTKGNAAFEAFAFKWIDERIADPSHHEHQTAKLFQEEGIFMSTTEDGMGRKQGDEERAKGTHLKYEKFARAHSYLMTPKARRDAEKVTEHIRQSRASTTDDMNQKIAAIKAKVDPLKVKYVDLQAQKYTPDSAEGIANELENIRRLHADFRREERKVIEDAGRKLMEDKMDAVSKFVPPGMEERYKELDRKIAEIEGGKKPKLNISLNTGSSSPPQPVTQPLTQPLTQAITQDPPTQSPAAKIESSKQLRAQEVALSHHVKMLKDAKRDLKRMKRGVPTERKAQLKGKIKALEEQHNQLQDKFAKLQAKNAPEEQAKQAAALKKVQVYVGGNTKGARALVEDEMRRQRADGHEPDVADVALKVMRRIAGMGSN